MAEKKKIIKIEENQNFVIFAVATTLDEFSFCNAINDVFGIALQIKPPATYELLNGTKVLHSFYSTTDDLSKTNFEVIANRTSKGVLIESMESVNYFVRCTSINIDSKVTDFAKKIMNIEGVLFVQKIGLSDLQLKVKNQLIHLFV